MFFDTKIVAVLFFRATVVASGTPLARPIGVGEAIGALPWSPDAPEILAAASISSIVSRFNWSCFFSSSRCASSKHRCGGRSPDLTPSNILRISSSSNELPPAADKSTGAWNDLSQVDFELLMIFSISFCTSDISAKCFEN